MKSMSIFYFQQVSVHTSHISSAQQHLDSRYKMDNIDLEFKIFYPDYNHQRKPNNWLSY